ncbi:hypothetical protein Bca52824_003794 [Brassica carinata]|uniref:Uncharacterized protein n=1 Tax=Brassica carinata TaxID=52824 RepID=A0A8X7WMU6_BRACI|nr:hypothetical protein Bca52824_003794 [Brassica carinata]
MICPSYLNESFGGGSFCQTSTDDDGRRGYVSDLGTGYAINFRDLRSWSQESPTWKVSISVMLLWISKSRSANFRFQNPDLQKMWTGSVWMGVAWIERGWVKYGWLNRSSGWLLVKWLQWIYVIHD